jgi:hypothetical protein
MLIEEIIKQVDATHERIWRRIGISIEVLISDEVHERIQAEIKQRFPSSNGAVTQLYGINVRKCLLEGWMVVTVWWKGEEG